MVIFFIVKKTLSLTEEVFLKLRLDLIQILPYNTGTAL
jgi:hypothetical protein